jgi:hypothetical protein
VDGVTTLYIDPIVIPFGSSATLEAVFYSYFIFLRWEGDIDSSLAEMNPVTVVMDADKTISVQFTYDGGLF